MTGAERELVDKSTVLRCPTRRTARGAAKLEALRRAAGELFLAHGYDGVSLDDVVRAAGGSKTNIYGFFGGKEGLFLAAVEAMCVELQGRLRAQNFCSLPLVAGLTAIGQGLGALLLEPRHLALFRLVIGETGRFPALGPLWYANGPGASHALIAAFLERHGHAPGAAAALARDFHDLAITDTLYRALIGAPPDAAERAQRVAASVERMLR